ncbi:hypothetical protein [Prochlorococcus marinus]|uniref:hypothetical protein n=1 Tax=Prochlorococcus marinus TaxID=1219 RepID=UPI001ADA4F9E|nr:hypothetical protein [Prochlorococcus marinus]MBO8219373.1 hypothetical protein [Prochlorococcus marinus CUG1416]MBW3051754.1 hypothetical protein [Prochlorococcus marinus str. MU1416]
MKHLLLPLLAAITLPTAINADHKFPIKDFNNRDDFSLALSIMEVGIARCKIAQGTISPDRATKILIRNLRNRMNSYEFDYHIAYMKTNAGNKFANEYALLSADNNCNKPDKHNFQKFYNKLAEFFN